MKEFLQGVMLFVAMGSIALVAEADPIKLSLQAHFQDSHSVHFLSYEKVEQDQSDLYQPYRYLVMDFKTEPSNTSLQASIHDICTTILSDLNLIRRLSNEGFDMISVSFDHQSQYDCL